jgi:alanine-glyoxylate transaminase/serine-glyoxylate transaminase/serine-pyruvate transaminase
MIAQQGHHFTQVPGPTNIPERVLNAMHRQAIDFSRPDFERLCESVYPDLKSVFRIGAGEVFIYAANGHGGWEAAISNVLAPGDRVLLPETGQFGHGWSEMARALGVEVELMQGDWRHAPDPAEVEARLREDKSGSIRAVLLVQTDTASSLTSDVPAFRGAMDAAGHEALLMVDSIAALAATDLRQSDWGVDVTVAASQKALMCPPGLAFVAASEKALAVAEANSRPNCYWDWGLRRERPHYRWFCGTPPQHLLFGLREALDMLAEEGLDAALRRHARLAGAVRQAVAAWAKDGAVEFNAVKEIERANSVTTIRMAEGIDAEAFRRYCRERFEVSLGGGLGRLAGQAFRIGHMGHVNAPMILGTLGAVEASLKALGIACGRGGVEAAVDWLAETSPVQEDR